MTMVRNHAAEGSNADEHPAAPRLLALPGLLCASVGAGMALAVAVMTAASAAPDPIVTCAIDVEETGRLVYLTARVGADEPVSGQALLAVRKSGPSGRSNNTQGTLFQLVGDGSDTVVGRVGVNRDPGGTLSADLRVEWPGGTTSCHYP